MTFSFCSVNLKGISGLLSSVLRWTLSEALGLGAVVLTARICGLATRHVVRVADLRRKGASFDAIVTVAMLNGRWECLLEVEAIVVTDSGRFKVVQKAAWNMERLDWRGRLCGWVLLCNLVPAQFRWGIYTESCAL